jgi:hypothetical protein
MKYIIQRLKIKLGYAILKFDRYLNRFAENVGLTGWCSMYGTLAIKHFKADGTVKDYGIVSRKKVTDEFVAYLAVIMVTDATTIGDFKYHISGTGTTAENNDHTELVTPIGTARTVGDQNSSTNTYISVATISYTDTLAVTEHGIFNAAYTSAQTDGTLLDRSVFAAVNVVNSESIQFSYTLTISPEA